ncbi:hypothetical protein ABZZ04_25830 [Streptomyces sp. NPDC006435]|uniref:hypothetical protein n=1 Tax=Streptomyces sp. NPDC006435 TaxID=3154300 RepID=UPI0033B7B05B
MKPTRWQRRSAHRALRRALRRFEVRLPSSYPGIAFTARIGVTRLSEPPFPGSVDEVAAKVRKHLREAAISLARECDPSDVSSARDALNQHLVRRRRLPTSPPVEFEAWVSLHLPRDDQDAVTELHAAQRRQAIADTLRRQRTDALARELSDPAAVLVRWLERDGADWRDHLPVATAETLAEVFASHRLTYERTVDHQALEVVKDFLDSFQDVPQKQMLYTLLAAGMHHANRPEHAAQASALLNGHSPPRRDGEG